MLAVEVGWKKAKKLKNNTTTTTTTPCKMAY